MEGYILLRNVKIGLIAAVAAWGFVGAFFNLIDWDGTLGAVQSATSMVTFDGGAESWQATSNPVLVWAGALFILLSKLTAAALCLLGVTRMWSARQQDAAAFATAKQIAIAGCGVAVFMLFGGFIIAAETWFEMWRSDVLRGPVLDSAFRYAAIIALIAIYVGTSDD